MPKRTRPAVFLHTIGQEIRRVLLQRVVQVSLVESRPLGRLSLISCFVDQALGSSAYFHSYDTSVTINSGKFSEPFQRIF